MRFFVAIASLLLLSAASADPHDHHHAQQFDNELQKGAPLNDRETYSHGFTLECDFALVRHYWGEMYTCIARNLVTRHHYDYIVNATGDHLSGKSDRDVKAIYILGQRTPYIPYNLTSPFGGSVVALRVESSGLRYLNRTFSYEGALEYMHFENNLIEDVPTWAFRNMTGLKWLSLRNNHIRYLEGTLLHGMTVLKRFSVSNNLIEVVPSGLFHDTSALEEIFFYNNKIRMVGWKLVEYVKGLKVAAFMGNPCTEISIYDGVKTVERLTAEFKSKCAVDCRRAEAAAQAQKQKLREEFTSIAMCTASDMQKKPMREAFERQQNAIRSQIHDDNTESKSDSNEQ